ncbi:MAG: type IX secretion system membrane protein PorP/SprF [Bacteroidales bacterium]|nr:type IX secretion system membrane protein PorP/SprF [Bacteroidales bacterium]
MKTKKIFALIISGTLLQLSAFAQNDIQISNFMFFGQTYNPAFAGYARSINATLLAREQWTGFKQAPSTQLLNFVFPAKNIGNFGLSIINDKLGFEKSINMRVVYAYPFALSDNSFISAGVCAGFINRTLEGSKLVYEDKSISDPNGIYTNTSEFLPTIDMGILYYDQNLTLGASSTHLTKSASKATFYDASRHYYIFGSYKIPLNETVDIVPSLYFKNSKFISQFEVNANLMFGDKLWAGLSYRWKESIVGLFGIKIMKSFKIGYSYDFNIGDVKPYSYGSHEIFISYSPEISKSSIYYKSPRLFN